jgi:hypothetical protein
MLIDSLCSSIAHKGQTIKVNGNVLVHSAIANLAGLLLIGAAAAQTPRTWDGLVEVKSTQLDIVLLQPGADFSGYRKVLIEPTEVAFAKNWQRDYNRSSRSMSTRISDRDIQRAITQASQAAHTIFSEAWSKGGYTVVATAGPDVLRVKTGIVNITVSAPDKADAGRVYSFAPEAGQATLFIEARDSLTGALLGRAIDHNVIGDYPGTWRTKQSNRADFRDQIKEWAKISVRGLSELRSRSPAAP